jgi:hypothetical protein
MIVKYIWYDNPDTEKLYDTEKSYKNFHVKFCSAFHMGPPMTAEEWDRFELAKIERDKARGLVISYEIQTE